MVWIPVALSVWGFGMVGGFALADKSFKLWVKDREEWGAWGYVLFPCSAFFGRQWHGSFQRALFERESPHIYKMFAGAFWPFRLVLHVVLFAVCFVVSRFQQYKRRKLILVPKV